MVYILANLYLGIVACRESIPFRMRKGSQRSRSCLFFGILENRSPGSSVDGITTKALLSSPPCSIQTWREEEKQIQLIKNLTSTLNVRNLLTFLLVAGVYLFIYLLLSVLIYVACKNVTMPIAKGILLYYTVNVKRII